MKKSTAFRELFTEPIAGCFVIGWILGAGGLLLGIPGLFVTGIVLVIAPLIIASLL